MSSRNGERTGRHLPRQRKRNAASAHERRFASQRLGAAGFSASTSSRRTGVAVLGRFEWELAARGGRLRIGGISRWTKFAPAPVSTWALRSRPPAPVFTTQFDRATAVRALPGARVSRSRSIEERSPPAERSQPLREIEFELLEGDFLPLLDRVRELIPALRLALDVDSKAERGYRLARRPAGRTDQGTPSAARRKGRDRCGDIVGYWWLRVTGGGECSRRCDFTRPRVSASTSCWIASSTIRHSRV